MFRTLRSAALLFCVLLWPDTLLAGVIDPHTVFEERCSRCHIEHAGAYTRTALTLREDGNLYGNKTGRRLPDFLANPPGSALPNEIAALLDLFAMQSRSGGVYDRKCAVCYTSANGWRESGSN